MDSKESLELASLKLENEYMKDNIKKLRNIIHEQEKEIQNIVNSKGYRLMEKIRRFKWWKK